MYNKSTDEIISKNILQYMKLYSSNDIIKNDWKIDFKLFWINSLKTIDPCNRKNFYTYLWLPYKIASLFTDYVTDWIKFSSKDSRVNEYLIQNKEKLSIKLYTIIHNAIGIWYQPVDVVGDKEKNNIALYKQNLYYPDTKNMMSGDDYTGIVSHCINKIFKDDKWDVRVYTKEYFNDILTTYTSSINSTYTKIKERDDEQIVKFIRSPFFLFTNNIVLGDNDEWEYSDFFDYIWRPEVYQVMGMLWYIIDLVTYTRIDIGKNWLPKMTFPAHFLNMVQSMSWDWNNKPNLNAEDFFINWENWDKPEYITKDIAYLEQMRVAIDKMMYQISNILDIPPNKLWLQDSSGNITATEIKKSQEWFYKRVQSKRVWFESQIKSLLQYMAWLNTWVYAEVDIEWKQLWDNVDQASTYIDMVSNQLIDKRTATKMILNIWDEEYDKIEINKIEEMKADWSLFG
jgi:hypothetical protein